ncbi:MAG: NADH-quinone oxidoreductase subunit J [Gammaproteobacteria bacterium]|nr:NADH-quinone oxidoreductase subunit J [Gammaproteobacteria bacterium]
MNIEPILFYLFSTILVISAGAVVTVRNPVFAALLLVLAFFTCASLWILLEAEFLALTLVLVYVGAVMVLFLFVVMMLDINLTQINEGFTKYAAPGIIIAAIIVIEIGLVLGADKFGLEHYPNPVGHDADYSNTKEIGNVLYTVYLYPFELAAVILVVAIIAAISLAQRRRRDSKYQDPSQQVLVRREDRVRIIKMASEKRRSSGEEDS